MGGYTKPCLWYDHLQTDGTIVKLQGDWELNVAKRLDARGIGWETAHRKKHWRVLSDGRVYIPDFYLLDFHIYVDPKLFWDVPDKYAKVRAEFPGQCYFLVGTSYMAQLDDLLNGLERYGPTRL